MASMSGSTVFGIIFGVLGSALGAAALWLHYATCRSVSSGNISTAGLTIQKVFTYIGLVGICIATAAMLVIAVLGGIFGSAFLAALRSEFGNDVAEPAFVASLAVVFAIFAVVCCLIFGLMIAYLACMIRFINRTKAVAASGIPDNRVPQFVVVLNYIFVVFTFIGALASLIFSPVAALASAVSGVYLLLITRCMTRYREEMTVVMYPPVQPVYAPEQGQPYQQ